MPKFHSDKQRKAAMARMKTGKATPPRRPAGAATRRPTQMVKHLRHANTPAKFEAKGARGKTTPNREALRGMSDQAIIEAYDESTAHDMLMFYTVAHVDPEAADKATTKGSEAAARIEAELKRRGYSGRDLYNLRSELYEKNRLEYVAMVEQEQMAHGRKRQRSFKTKREAESYVENCRKRGWKANWENVPTGGNVENGYRVYAGRA